MMKTLSVFAGLMLASSCTLADSSTLDAAIGGGLGGAAGAAIGNELGGREGAIVGGAIGGGVGAAVTTSNSSREAELRHRESETHRDYRDTQRSDHFCPPGQAKKGRC